MNSKLIADSNGVTINGMSIKSPLEGITNLGDVINKVVPFIMSIAGIVLFLVLVWGGYDFMSSQGDAGKVKSARAKITAGFIGFVLLILSYFLTRLISYIFGIGGEMF